MKRQILVFLPLLLAFHAGAAEEDTAAQQFTAMLANATLHGTWAPIGPKGLGDDQDDRYRIVRVAPVDGDRWVVVSRMKIKDKEIELPIPVTIKFARDTAVMILDNVPLGGGQTWSARILFHDDVYAGSWWGADKAAKSGIVSGTITREKDE